jgi:exodeoxyribonuclease-3
MKIASWNVNSIRVRLPHVQAWLALRQPDVLGLQEIKVPTEAFPAAELAAAGYTSIIDGQKTYNGVALLSREEPSGVARGIPEFPDDQKRLIAASYGTIRVINLYAPNGQSVGSEKYAYKLAWLNALRDYLESELQDYPRLLVMGDFNIAPQDRDVHDPDEWRERILCSTPEREKLQALAALGLVDAFRLFQQPEKSFSWWDYRAAAFRRNRGLRIDLMLVSHALAKQCTASRIDVGPRRLERPSDHAPVWSEFSTDRAA